MAIGPMADCFKVSSLVGIGSPLGAQSLGRGKARSVVVVACDVVVTRCDVVVAGAVVVLEPATVSDGVTTLASFTYWGARPKGATFQNGMTEARTYTGFRGEVQQVLHQSIFCAQICLYSVRPIERDCQ